MQKCAETEAKPSETWWKNIKRQTGMANCWAGNTRAMWHANTYTCQYVSPCECVYVHLFLGAPKTKAEASCHLAEILVGVDVLVCVCMCVSACVCLGVCI